MARGAIKQSANFTKKMAVNISSATSMQDMAGETVHGLTACAILTDVDRETGEEKQVGVVVTHDGTYSTISASVIDQLYDVIDLLDEGEDMDMEIIRRTSKGGRDFLNIRVF